MSMNLHACQSRQSAHNCIGPMYYRQFAQDCWRLLAHFLGSDPNRPVCWPAFNVHYMVKTKQPRQRQFTGLSSSAFQRMLKERPHHVSSLTLNNSQQPANFASCRASDTLTRSFARYKFVTYLLTFKNSIFFALVFSGMRSIDSSSVKHSYLVELGWETALQALAVRNFTQP